MTSYLIDHVVGCAVSAFSRLLGPPIDLWILRSDGWQHAVDAVQHDLEAAQLEAGLILPETLPADLNHLQEPVVDEVSPGIFLIGTPISIAPTAQLPNGATIMAWGTVQTSSRALVTNLLRISREKRLLEQEASDLRLGLNPHLEQISYNFEELTYLRRLGEQIDLRDVADPLTDLAERILGELRSLIKAEGLGFILSVNTNQISGEPTLGVGKPVAWKGTKFLDDARCAQLIEMTSGCAATGRPFIDNHMGMQRRFRAFPEIQSCIYVPVVHHGTCFGWLIALNRVPWNVRSTLPNDIVPTGFCDNEFGTVEASLMNSVAATIAAHYRNSELFREKELLLIGVVRALINAIDAKDSYTCGHSDRVAVIAKCIGEQLGLDSRECERLYMSGLLHDLGKIGIPDHVLCKPGKLTDEEFAIIQQHPTIGYSILNHLPQLQHVLPGVLHHHESFNGRGYPGGLSEEQIPLFARILAVSDAYDAMTSARPYREAMPTEKAEAILAEGAGTQWDSNVVQAFLKALPAIEAAGENAPTHLRELLSSTSDSGDSANQSQVDTIARAVTAINS